MKKKLIIWIALCLITSILFFSELWAKLPQWLSPAGLQQYGVFHWGVLGLCFLLLWLKRRDIVPKMSAAKPQVPFILGGLVLLVLSIFLPQRDDFLMFLVLLGWLGLFAIFFARAIIIPAILLLIYAFSILFPILATNWLGQPSALLASHTVIAITRVLGLPITGQGQVLHLTSTSGEAISTVVSAECAGYATIGVFIALFSLMMLDVRLPWRHAGYVFLIGLVGTWLQNIIRIVVSLIAAYFWGSDGLDAVHYAIAYIIFPLWFGLFAFVYLRWAGFRLVLNDRRHLHNARA